MSDTPDLECPVCGATFSYSFTRCPECGHNMYPEDGAGEPWDPGWAVAGGPAAGAGGYAWGAVLSGWLIGAVVAFVFQFLATRFLLGTAAAPTPLVNVLRLLAGPLGALAGGYLAASLALPRGLTRRRLLAHLAAVGVLLLPVAALLDSYWRVIDWAAIVQPASLLSGVLTVAGALAGGGLYLWLLERATRLDETQTADQLYADLLARVRYARDVADRLIAYEQRRNPRLSEAEAIRQALQRWERDNR